MKKLINLLIICAVLLALNPLLAVEDIEIIKSEKINLAAAGGELTVKKFFADEEICVEVVDKSGNKLLEMPSMGTREKMFQINGKPASLAIADVTGDGVEEILASAFYGPASALYVFKFDSASKKFSPIKFADSDDAELHREFMVSDLPSDNGSDMTVKEDLRLVARGKIYPSSPEESVKAGEYTFKYADGVFKLIKTEEIKGGE